MKPFQSDKLLALLYQFLYHVVHLSLHFFISTYVLFVFVILFLHVLLPGAQMSLLFYYKGNSRETAAKFHYWWGKKWCEQVLHNLISSGMFSHCCEIFVTVR